MSATRDGKDRWRCQFYYTDWMGQRKRKCKRGFATKHEALEWEAEYKLSANANMSMTLANFVEIYFRDKSGELKERTAKNKRYMIDMHVIPFFGTKPMNEITPADVIQWQNKMREKGFSQTYLRMIQNQLTALFTHASNIYNLANNPCKKVKKMGKSDADRLDFWTIEEYNKFIATVEKDTMYYVLFELLFWTGVRIGEALALTKGDIDFNSNQMHIDKTYYRADGRDIITTPKTEQSVRTVELPKFLSEEIKDYTDRIYGMPDDARLFPVVNEAVQHKMKRHTEKAGIKKIRVHDFRHSHVAYLINQGVDPLIIKERLGHKDIKITLNTYGHLYPSKQRAVADMLNARNSVDNG